MVRRYRRWVGATAIGVVCGLVGLAGASGLEPSSQTATALVTLMKSRNLDAFAAPDPETPDRFVAAMLVPGVQLLVVAAKSTSPEYMKSQIAQRQYRDVYAALHASAVPESKVFFQDMGCDGLSLDGSSSTDIMYERNTAQTIFDGDWKRQKISKPEYDEKLRKADAEYSRLLGVLTETLRATSGGV
jgi:hypothetical protein